MSTRVALVGAGGHGVSHRRALAPLHERGVIELVAMCDLAPVRDEPGAPVPAGTRVFTDYRQLLAATEPAVVVICTPPHTHLEIATAAAQAGADLLLEKPPLLAVAEHRALMQVLARTGRACQVGFQALGSAALAELAATVSQGGLGVVTAVSAVGAWQRPDSYYQRTPWAGKRSVDGRQVLDGALANPFAHAIMQCLAVAEAVAGTPVWPVEIELERYRARPIEVDDTAVLRVRTDRGPLVLVAVSLCGDARVDGDVLVHAEPGRAVLGYTTDRLRLPGEPTARVVPGRVGLLENLLAHRAEPQVPLLAPLRRAAGFTALAEALLWAPEPHDIDPSFLEAHGDGPARVVTVRGITRLLRRCAAQLALPADLGTAWAAPAWRTRTTTARGLQATGG